MTSVAGHGLQPFVLVTVRGVVSELDVVRAVGFYLPPIWGYSCHSWLVKHRYL